MLELGREGRVVFRGDGARFEMTPEEVLPS